MNEAEPEKVAEQRRLYGEPVGDLVRRVTTGLGLTQARVAGVLGLSPAMLSQLMSGHRVKIGNPQALSRLQSLLALTEEAPSMTREAITRRLSEIRDTRSSLTTSQQATTPPADAADVVRRLLHAVASGRELDAAARALADVAPGLADLVRIYGTGSRDDAARHLAGVAHLL
ncbi:DNA-binding protein [Nocardioides sp. MH1]|uniref:DNA-binding protein n=1 Tax=Nocardioides sp. MH1 TaxID=3242490 RepID=UPI0035216AE4